MNKSLTIFTPTYNRAYILPNVYEDLKNQTNKDFIWLIVDDGSSDNTQEIIDIWKKENKINIEFFKQPNGGKYTAINKSFELCTTGYYAIIDSDDSVTENFVQFFHDNIDKIHNENCILGLCTPKHYSNNPHTCETYPTKEQLLFYHELKTKYNFHAETTVFLRMDIVKDFRFPVIPEERFMSEVLIGNEFFYKHKFLSINEHISSSEYLEDGITAQSKALIFKHPYATMCIFKSYAHHKVKAGRFFWSRNSIARHTRYHGWVRAFKLDKSRVTQWPLGGFSNFIGKLLSPLASIVFKRRYKKFLKGTKQNG